MSTTHPPLAVLARGLRKHFGQVRAVDGVDIEIPAGQIVALLGPNGAGKTTTLDMMLGTREPDQGVVELLGSPPRRALDEGDVGAMLQTGELLTGAYVAELLHAMAALHRHPAPMDEIVATAGLDGVLRRRTERLSGGEAQRVRFALALVGNPRLLVLDEPTAGLDVTARRAFWASVRSCAAAGRTILFSTHYLEEADENADRIIVMHAGRIVADGAATVIKAGIAGRLIRCTLPGATPDSLAALPSVSAVEIRGDAVTIRSTDSDITLRALLSACGDARDIEVSAAPLADAFIALTSHEPVPGPAPRPEADHARLTLNGAR